VSACRWPLFRPQLVANAISLCWRTEDGRAAARFDVNQTGQEMPHPPKRAAQRVGDGKALLEISTPAPVRLIQIKTVENVVCE